LQENAKDAHLQQVGDLKTNLNILENKVVSQRINLWLKWRMKGHACTNELFAVVKEKSKASIIIEL
jgi:hypothetical protein